MELIVIAGMPATGKSTVAAGIAKVFGYPVLEKDDIKERLFDTIGFENYPQKRRLDIAATSVLLKVLEQMLKAGTSVIVVNNFDGNETKQLSGLIETYKPACVTVFLNGDPQVLYERYVERDRLHKRHLGHILQEHYPPHEEDALDYTMTREEFDEKFFKRGMGEFQCPGGRVEADTTMVDAVDMDKMVREIQVYLKEC